MIPRSLIACNILKWGEQDCRTRKQQPLVTCWCSQHLHDGTYNEDECSTYVFVFQQAVRNLTRKLVNILDFFHCTVATTTICMVPLYFLPSPSNKKKITAFITISIIVSVSYVPPQLIASYNNNNKNLALSLEVPSRIIAVNFHVFNFILVDVFNLMFYFPVPYAIYQYCSVVHLRFFFLFCSSRSISMKRAKGLPASMQPKHLFALKSHKPTHTHILKRKRKKETGSSFKFRCVWSVNIPLKCVCRKGQCPLQPPPFSRLSKSLRVIYWSSQST